MKIQIVEWIPIWERRIGIIDVPDDVAADDELLRDWLNEEYNTFADSLAIDHPHEVETMDSSQNARFPDGRVIGW